MTPRRASGEGLRIGVAVADFNGSVTSGLLEGALEELRDSGCEDVLTVHVPGALELPLAARRLLDAGCAGVVAIGAVIEGETDHYAHVATQSLAGLSQVMLESDRPITNAVLTVRDAQHAVERSGSDPSNKGREATNALLVTLEAFRRIDTH